MKTPLAEITVGKRRREDYGDLEGLAESIKKYGLLHPVVVDDQGNLVAGERRLKACQMLRWPEIDTRSLGELSETERHEIELEENLRRKDLTPYERSKTLVEYVETVKETAKEELRSHSDHNAPGRGRPREQGSYRDIEERTGIPHPTIIAAKQHVAAADRYPELRGIPQSNAITIAKNLDAMPEPEREAKVAALRRHDQDTLAELAGLPPMPKGPSPQEVAANDPGTKWLKAMHQLQVIVSGVRDNGGIAVIAERWSDEHACIILAEIALIHQEIGDWKNTLEERNGNASHA